MLDSSYKFIDYQGYKAHSFFCMGGLCEVLIETSDSSQSKEIFNPIYNEAKRIEQKFSRYRDDNIIFKINHAGGKKITLDKETRKLLSFADSMYYASDGLFDITSGVLRQAWTFDGSSNAPESQSVEKLRKYIGWKRVQIQGDRISMPPGAELDFGGIGKEYAVDRCLQIAKSATQIPFLINFGGDIAVSGPKKNGMAWNISVDQTKEELKLFHGAVATSGDKNRFLIVDGKRLSHILNPKTGYPIEGAPKSVTVVAQNCTEAGALATLALLKGADAEIFLREQAETFRVVW